jgi:catalase (peroxidase I)
MSERPRHSAEGVFTAKPGALGNDFFVSLLFGSNSELRAVAEAYASDDAKQLSVNWPVEEADNHVDGHACDITSDLIRSASAGVAGL